MTFTSRIFIIENYYKDYFAATNLLFVRSHELRILGCVSPSYFMV
jgi:hypothetical protein